jgi:twitching motility protein PilJ
MNKEVVNNRWAAMLPVFTVLTALFVISAAVLAYLMNAPAAPGADRGQMPSLLERIPFEAQNALRGEPGAFDSLAASMTQATALRAPGGAEADASWHKISDAVGTVGAARTAVTTVQAVNQEVHDLSPKLFSALGDLASAADLPKSDAMNHYLQRFELTAQRMQQDMNGLAGGVSDVAPAAQRLADGTAYLNQVVRGLSGEESAMALPRITGADGEARLKALVQSNQRFTDSVRKVTAVADTLAHAQAAAQGLPAATAAMRAEIGPESAGAGGADDNLKRGLLISLALALVLLVATALMYRKAFNTRRAIETQVLENERNQDAIMRLLNELSNLADGDLTVQATVTEDITGAIADSINYAIEALRELVTTINDSAIQLDGATRQTQTFAAGMAKASSAQSKQITSASQSMADMASSIEEVSGNSERCADVARHSVDIAHKGGDAVRRTIDGMNAIRETIQETSKRIKRLGESSQEIGNTVELINDIAEQTNILALNASIQASMAGEAGRGFAVVADEVQRLAERAANATKQIEVLVRTIQTDTNEAVVSMERTTTDVVGGALLAENAGAALEEIEQVSNQIANLVQNISASARQQAVASGSISKNMQVVRDISTQTAEGSAATSSSVSKLAALAAQLRKSVAGFRLPDLGRAAPAPSVSTGTTSTRLPVLQEQIEASDVSADATGKRRKLSGVGV